MLGQIGFMLFQLVQEQNIVKLRALLNPNGEALKFINMKNSEGMTLLMWAVYKGNKDIVELLIKNGADIHANNKRGETALCYASCYGYSEIVKFLIKNGADVNTTGHIGVSMLCYALANDHREIVEFLIKQGADVNASDIYGNTVFSYALHNARTEIAEVLIKNGADVNVEFEEGQTAIEYAAANNYWNVVYLLMTIEKERRQIDSARYQRLFWQAVGAKQWKLTTELLKLEEIDQNSLFSSIEYAKLVTLVEANQMDLIQRCEGGEIIAHSGESESAVLMSAIRNRSTTAETVAVFLKIFEIEVDQEALCIAVQSGQFDKACRILKHPKINMDVLDGLSVEELRRFLGARTIDFSQMALSQTGVTKLVQAGYSLKKISQELLMQYAEHICLVNIEQLNEARDLQLKVKRVQLEITSTKQLDALLDEFGTLKGSGCVLAQSLDTSEYCLDQIWLPNYQLTVQQYFYALFQQIGRPIKNIDDLPHILGLTNADWMAVSREYISELSGRDGSRFCTWLQNVTNDLITNGKKVLLEEYVTDYVRFNQIRVERLRRAVVSYKTTKEMSGRKKSVLDQLPVLFGGRHVSLMEKYRKFVQQNCQKDFMIDADYEKLFQLVQREKNKFLVSYSEEENQLFLFLAWILIASGKVAEEMLPEFCCRIGPLYKDIGSVNFGDLIMIKRTPVDRSKVYDIEEVARCFEQHKKFVDPATQDEITDQDVISEFIWHPKMMKTLLQLHYAALDNNEIVRVMKSTLENMKELGRYLANDNNSDVRGAHFDEGKANEALINFHNYMNSVPSEKYVLSGCRYYLRARGQETNYDDLFNKAMHGGCTRSLGKAILEWVNCYQSAHQDSQVTQFSRYIASGLVIQQKRAQQLRDLERYTSLSRQMIIKERIFENEKPILGA